MSFKPVIVPNAAATDEEPSPEIQRLHEAVRIAEAVLFASPAPLDDAALEARLPDGTVLEQVIEELRRHYRLRGIHLVRAGGGWTFRTAPDLAGYLAEEVTPQRKLSRAQLETLAIVAYHQPVTRAEIEEIRGVTLHKGTLDLLVETGWVQPKGRRETPGRPITWVTTPAFLEHFALDSLRDLPNVDELRAAGLLDPRPMTSLGENVLNELGEGGGEGARTGFPGEEEDGL